MKNSKILPQCSCPIPIKRTNIKVHGKEPYCEICKKTVNK